MSEHRFGAARYRVRATLRHRWSGYVALAIMVALIGGLGLGSLAAARRTQSSFSTFIATTNPSDLSVSVYSGALGGSANPNYDPSLTARIARLPDVRHVAAGFELTGAPLTPNGTPRIRVTGEAFPMASVNGLYFSQDRVAVTAGRMASPSRPDEIMMAPIIARQLGFHVGQVIPYGFYSDAEESLPAFGTNAVQPALRVNLKLVGLASLNSEIVEDDFDTLPTLIPLTPRLRPRGAGTQGGGVRRHSHLRHSDKGRGHHGATRPARDRRADPPRSRVHRSRLDSSYRQGGPFVEADRYRTGGLRRTVSPRGPADCRSVDGATFSDGEQRSASPPRNRSEPPGHRSRRARRIRGCDPRWIDTCRGGRRRSLADCADRSRAVVYPFSGISFDWTVLGFGVLALSVLLSAVGFLLAFSAAPHRVVLRLRIRSTSGAQVVAAVARAGVSGPGVVGVRMALEPGGGRTAVPVRSALLGAVLAVALVVTTLTFGNSLHTLVSSPALYGWNWTYILNPVGAGSGNVPPVALSLLQRDRYVAASSGASYNEAELDGQGVPFLIENVHAAVAPPVLSGHGIEGRRQVVLGAATMAQLHRHLGQYVTVSFGARSDAPIYVPPTWVLIVGTATFPAIGYASTISDHTSMGTGMLLPFQILPKAFANALDSSSDPALDGPNLALVRVKSDAPPAEAFANLQRMVRVTDKVFAAEPGGAQGNGIVVQGVQRPAEIVNYRTIGVIPVLLVSGLALGVIVALALTLAASVRQRRRDLALLKAVGFIRWQLAAVVAWQATVAAVVGIVIGIPLGIVAGRWRWTLFARQIYAVPDPTVSVVSIVLVAVGTVVLANVVAAIPARTAARTTIALILRSE